MRDELIKFERYQKQFLFLYDNDIETLVQLTSFKRNVENNIEDLTTQRKQLYEKDDSKDKIAEINKELRALRKDVRMCDRIMTDVAVIKEHNERVEKLDNQTKSSIKKPLLNIGKMMINDEQRKI